MNAVSKMVRFSEVQIRVIKDAVHQLDKEAEVYLFGSRTDLNERGGDIDLLIVSEQLSEKDRIPLKLALYDGLGEQKIDLIIAREPYSAFQKMALEAGVRL
ncbi:MAG: nucleotidyltransferase domain-containing protein [Bacteroidia bacterium]|nr:nucleotidyltransferase domain-containing protein [Bacteroidia bacterium]